MLIYIYVYMYICMYIYIYIDVDIYIYMYIHVMCMDMYIYVYMHVVYICVYIHARGYMHLSIHSALIGLFSPWGRVSAGWGSMPCGMGKALSQGGSLDAESVRDRWMQQSLRYSEIVSTLRQKLILSDFSSLSTATLFYF